MTPKTILSETGENVKEKVITIVNGTVKFDVIGKKRVWDDIDNKNINMNNLIIPLRSGEFAVLTVHNISIERDGKCGRINFNVSIALDCEQVDGLIAANYYLNELNIEMDKLFVSLNDNNCAMLDVMGIWFEWEATE